jgi:hypothetical protein
MIDAKITLDPVAGIIQAFRRAAKVASLHRDIELALHLAQSLDHSQLNIEKAFNNGLARHGNLQLETLLDDGMPDLAPLTTLSLTRKQISPSLNYRV